MRYPTRAYQSDTTVVSNDRRRPHQVSQTKAAPAPTGAAFTYPLDKTAYISGSQPPRRMPTPPAGGLQNPVEMAEAMFRFSWRTPKTTRFWKI